MERKIYENKEKLIESELKRIKNIMSKMLDNLPNEELPFMENHLRALYFETYFLLIEGFYNASLVMCGILLENLVKERLFNKGVKDKQLEKMTFGEAIKKCKEKDFLTQNELVFLKEKKEKLRDPYAHYNKIKLSKGVYFAVGKIKNPVKKLIELSKMVKRGEITEAQVRQKLVEGTTPKLMSSEEFRPISQIAKSQIESTGYALMRFLEADKFLREFAEKYFKPKE
jgi:hypothetical protein